MAFARLVTKGFYWHLQKWNGQPRTQFLNADRMLDAAASGPLWLKDPEIAGIVDRTIRRGAELAQYILRAYVVMPNHVHLLLEPRVSLQKVTGGIKGVSAHNANAKLGRTGSPFWQTSRSITGFAIPANSPSRRPTSRTIL